MPIHLTRRDTGLNRPLLPILNCNRKTSGQATLVFIYYPRKPAERKATPDLGHYF
jgi:hypothetical protein